MDDLNTPARKMITEILATEKMLKPRSLSKGGNDEDDEEDEEDLPRPLAIDGGNAEV